MGFDVSAAKKAGYTDQEIIGHLATTRKFDVDGARKAGYSDADILAHISRAAAPPSAGPTLRLPSSPGIPLGEADPGMMAEFPPGENLLPAIGGVGGAGLGAAVGQPFYGALLGSGAGHAVKNLMLRSRGAEVNAEEAGKSALTDMILAPFGAATGAKVTRPFGAVSPATQETIRYAAEKGVPISGDILHPSMFTKGVAWISNAFWPGRLAGNKYRQKLFVATERMANDIVSSAAKESGVSAAMAGKPLREGMREAQSLYGQIGKQGYSAQAELAKDYGTEIVRIPKFREALGGLKNNAALMSDKKVAKYLNTMLKETEDGITNFHDLTNIYNRINRNMKGSQNSWAVEHLFDAIHSDMSEFGKLRDVEIVKAFVKAKEVWKDKRTFDKVFQVFHKASKEDDFGNVYFNPDILLDATYSPSWGLSAQLEKSFGKQGAAEKIQEIRKFGNFMKLARQEAHRQIGSREGAAQWYQYIGAGDMAFGASSLVGMGDKLPYMSVPWSFSYIATLQNLKPNSWMKKWLGSSLGSTPPKLGPMIGAGTGIKIGDLGRSIREGGKRE